MIQEPLFMEERKLVIVERIEREKKVLVTELVYELGVSPTTIRNDLRELEQKGFIRRTHGGAISINMVKAGFEPDNERKGAEKTNQKRSIALKAVEFIEEGDIIILDSGTTMLEMAKEMKDKQNITIIVNDLEIARCLEECSGIHVIIIGGSLRRSFQCTVGPLAVNLLSELNVDKAFLATNGFSIDKGCTTPDISQAEVKKTMAKVSAQVILLCDSSKMETNSFVQFAPLTAIDVIITDSGIDQDLLTKLASHGCATIVAG